MKKHQSVGSLRRPKKTVYKFVLTDEVNPGAEFVIELIDPSISRLICVGELVEQWIDFYKTPDPVSGELPEIWIPDEDGNREQLQTTRELIELACGIFALQKEPIHSVEDIMILTETMQAGMMQVIGKSKELSSKFAALMENPTPAAITPLTASTSDDQDVT